MKSLYLPLVDWGMGTFIIGVFAVVCVVLVLVIYNLTRTKDAPPPTTNSENTKESSS